MTRDREEQDKCPAWLGSSYPVRNTNFAFLSHSRRVKRFISSQPPPSPPPLPVPLSSVVVVFFLRLRWINGTRSFSVFLFLLLSYGLPRVLSLSPSPYPLGELIGANFPYDQLFSPPLIFTGHRDGCFVLKLSARPRWIARIFNYTLYKRSTNARHIKSISFFSWKLLNVYSKNIFTILKYIIFFHNSRHVIRQGNCCNILMIATEAIRK